MADDITFHPSRACHVCGDPVHTDTPNCSVCGEPVSGRTKANVGIDESALAPCSTCHVQPWTYVDENRFGPSDLYIICPSCGFALGETRDLFRKLLFREWNFYNTHAPPEERDGLRSGYKGDKREVCLIQREINGHWPGSYIYEGLGITHAEKVLQFIFSGLRKPRSFRFPFFAK